MYALNDRVVAITGSTGGFGSGLAVELRRRGAKVALLDRQKDLLEKQVTELGGKEFAKYWIVDVVDSHSLDVAMKEADAYFGRIDVVIANAGVDTFIPVEATDPDSFAHVIDVNLTGVFRTCKAAIPYVKKHQGYLAIISSMAAFAHSPMQAAYCASKAGLIAFANSMRLELRQDKVDVGTFHPGFVDTPLLKGALEQPASLELFCNFQPGTLFAKTPIEKVITGIVDGIERRNALVTVPQFHYIVALTGGIWRFIFELFFYRSNVEKALKLWWDDHNRNKTY